MHFVRRAFKKSTFSANVWLTDDFATQLLFLIFLKANVFSKPERKKLQIFLMSKLNNLFLGSEFSSHLARLFLPVSVYANEAKC